MLCGRRHYCFVVVGSIFTPIIRQVYLFSKQNTCHSCVRNFYLRVIIDCKMSSSTRVEIELNRESKTYFPEQYMEGRVIVYVIGEVKVESILLCISGVATVLRDEQSTQTPRIKRHVYFDKVASLYTYQEGHEKGFPEGKNIFPFRFRLPRGLPSSIESSGGNVRYWVRALLDEIDKPTESAIELFSVNALLDLNRLSRASWVGRLKAPGGHGKRIFIGPIRDTVIEKFPVSGTEKVTNKRCGCLWRRWVSVHLHLQRRAFVPGEFISANVDIENMNADPIVLTKLSLVQVVSFKGSRRAQKERRERRVASESIRGSVMPYEAQAWRNEVLVVPPLPCSSPPNALIVTNYYVTLEAQSRREKMNVEVQVPVLIGCVPLKQCLHHFEDGSGDQTVPGQDWPLPNYEPCVFGPHDTSVSGDDVMPEFSPCYVSYSTTKDVNKDSSSTSCEL